MSKYELPIPKEEVCNYDYMKFVLFASASSTRFGTIKLYEAGGKTFDIRGNINALIVSPFGTGKTSQILRIHNVKIVNANDMSFPGLIGTITRNGELVFGSCMRAGGKLLIIDEAQLIDQETRNAMNSLLEYPHTYSRNLGYKMTKFVRRNSKYTKIRGSENQFTVYSKFSCIASQMYLRLKTTIDSAWWSRFIHIRLKPTLEYMKKFLAGETIFDIEAMNEEASFTFKDYLLFHSEYFKNLEESVFSNVFREKGNLIGYISRNLTDVVRLASVIAILNGRTEILFEDADFILKKYWRTMMYNALLNPLTNEEYGVLNLINEPQEKIAEKLGISQAEVSRIISDLSAKGLIIKRE